MERAEHENLPVFGRLSGKSTLLLRAAVWTSRPRDLQQSEIIHGLLRRIVEMYSIAAAVVKFCFAKCCALIPIFVPSADSALLAAALRFVMLENTGM